MSQEELNKLTIQKLKSLAMEKFYTNRISDGIRHSKIEFTKFIDAAQRQQVIDYLLKQEN